MEFHWGQVSRKENPPIRGMFGILVWETESVSLVAGFHGHELSILVKMHTAGRNILKIPFLIFFLDLIVQFQVILGGTKIFGRKDLVIFWMMGEVSLVPSYGKPFLTNGNVWVKSSKVKCLMNIGWMKVSLY